MENQIFNQEKEFETQYRRITPIIINCQKKYRISSWTMDDYYQEGRICLFQLLEAGCSAEKVPVYFKVKFSHQLIDTLRRENAGKRLYNASNYVDLDKVEYRVADTSYQIDQSFLYEEAKSAFLSKLKPREKQDVLDLMQGKSINRLHKSRLKKKFIQFLLERDNDL